MPRVVIAGVSGGSGKTTLTLSIISALKKLKHLKVIPYKKGPDYIDSGWMSFASGSPCFNLDTFLISGDNVLRSFAAHYNGDIALIEGNRGLHDGFDTEGSHSTAELAKLTKSPVILIVDCTKMTRTSAAVVLGCMKLDPEVNISGVVLNRISGKRHESVARASIEHYCGVPVVGAIPRFKDAQFMERHMGLVPHQEAADTEKVFDMFLSIAKEHINIEQIIKIANSAPALNMPLPDAAGPEVREGIRIGIIRDTAFQFYYPENLEELRKRGAELVEIDSINSSSLPDIHCLYIGGGFPETNAIKLAANETFRRSVKNAVENGLPVYAECGGLMFLGRAIISDGVEYPMAGIFPLSFEMKSKPEAHGYTIAEVSARNPFYPEGVLLHGHEFHYSKVVDADEEGLVFAFNMQRGSGIAGRRDALIYKNVLAAYVHVHALGAPQWADGMIHAAAEYKKSGMVS